MKLRTDNGINTTVGWIPSHAGIESNEKVDSLAKKAAAKRKVDLESNKLTKSDIKQLIETEINKKWQEMYDKSITGLHYKKLVPRVTREIKHSDKNRSRERLITRLRLGKCLLNHYLHEIHLHPTGLCDHCKIPETIEHYLLHCQHSNIFHNSPVSIQEALTDSSNYDKIYTRTTELKRRL